MKRFWDKVNKTETCWLWTAWKNNKGYGMLMYKHPNGGFSNRLAHRISWVLTNGPIEDGLCVLHRCDNPSCVRPDHLFLGTKKDNTQDMLKKGRHKHVSFPGEKHHNARLTNAQAKEIRHFFFAERRTARELAEYYGVPKHCIDDIALGRTYKADGTPA